MMYLLWEEKESCGISPRDSKVNENSEVQDGKLNIPELCTWSWHAMIVSSDLLTLCREYRLPAFTKGKAGESLVVRGPLQHWQWMQGGAPRQ